MIHQPLTPANDTAETPVDVLAAAHLAALASVHTLTDFASTLYNADRLARRVRWYASCPASGRGMLGENGIAPQIRDCVRSAEFHGFRIPPVARPAVVGRMLMEAL